MADTDWLWLVCGPCYRTHQVPQTVMWLFWGGGVAAEKGLWPLLPHPPSALDGHVTVWG